MNKNKVFNNFNLKNKSSKNLIVLIAVVSILGFIFYNSDRFHKGKNFSKHKQNSVTKIYNNCIKLLSKKGFNKKDYQTAKEFSEYVVSNGGARYKIFEDFTTKYSIMRFQNKYSNSDISYLKNLLTKIKKVS